MTYAMPVADPTAVMGRRIGAYVLDAVIGAALLVAVLVPLFSSKLDTTTFSSDTAASDYCSQVNDDTFSEFESSGRTTRNELPPDSSFCANIGNKAYVIRGEEANSLVGQMYLWSFISGSLNTIVLQGLTGATVGKFLFGLRTVKEDGSAAGFGKVILRQLVGVVDGFCCGVVGLAVAFNSSGHRRIGDMAASTYVVDKAAMGAPIQVPGSTPTAYAPAAAWGQTPTAWGAPASPANPDPDGPTWDPARNAYIQYDREVGEWVQWDDHQKAWRPIDQ
ncbi:MAG: RDD family protein [Actinobacteria bacterium]|nr:RDD family protein [Actinomycetota bacterium]